MPRTNWTVSGSVALFSILSVLTLFGVGSVRRVMADPVTAMSTPDSAPDPKNLVPAQVIRVSPNPHTVVAWGLLTPRMAPDPPADRGIWMAACRGTWAECTVSSQCCSQSCIRRPRTFVGLCARYIPPIRAKR
jgi:hypothetical protein